LFLEHSQKLSKIFISLSFKHPNIKSYQCGSKHFLIGTPLKSPTSSHNPSRITEIMLVYLLMQNVDQQHYYWC